MEHHRYDDADGVEFDDEEPDLAVEAAALVKEIKGLKGELNESNKKRVRQAIATSVAVVLLVVGLIGFALFARQVNIDAKERTYTACVNNNAGRDATKQTFNDFVQLLADVPPAVPRTPAEQEAHNSRVIEFKRQFDERLSDRLPTIDCEDLVNNEK